MHIHFYKHEPWKCAPYSMKFILHIRCTWIRFLSRFPILSDTTMSSHQLLRIYSMLGYRKHMPVCTVLYFLVKWITFSFNHMRLTCNMNLNLWFTSTRFTIYQFLEANLLFGQLWSHPKVIATDFHRFSKVRKPDVRFIYFKWETYNLSWRGLACLCLEL